MLGGNKQHFIRQMQGLELRGRLAPSEQGVVQLFGNACAVCCPVLCAGSRDISQKERSAGHPGFAAGRVWGLAMLIPLILYSCVLFS
jgi:hypothetical protein